jgi:hypothetical protein
MLAGVSLSGIRMPNFSLRSLRAAFFLLPVLLLAACGGNSSSASQEPPAAVAFTTTSLPAATLGLPYSATLAVANGKAPYTFSVISGSAPQGLTLSSAGVLSGTPAGPAGSYPFTVQVADSSSPAGTASEVLTLAIAAPLSLSGSFPDGFVGAPYSAALQATGGTGPYNFALASGTLPAGLSLAANGAIAGTPSTAGTSTFSISVTDSSSPAHQSSTASFTVTISSSPLVLPSATLPAATLGTAYAASLQASGGTPPYSFGVTGGGLPPGISLSSGGALAGTPTAYGSYNFSVTVSDSSQPALTATTSFNITVNATMLTILTASLPDAQEGAAYNASLQSSGGTAPYTYAVTSGGLPTGISLSAGGVLSGTANSPGTSSFSVTVTDSSHPAEMATASFTLTVDASVLAITTATLPNAQINTGYSATVQASGGTVPYTYSLASGSFPQGGFTLSPSGVITGNPSALGSATFTIQVQDESSPQQTATATYTVNVVNALVNVNTASVLATVPQSAFGMHTSVYDGLLSDSAALGPLFNTSGITTLRYPGGIYADVYHWAQASITPFMASTSPACGIASNGYLAPGADFASFVKTLQATGTQAVLTINYGTSVANASASKSVGSFNADNCSEPNTFGQPQEAAAWVAYTNGDASNTTVIGTDAAGFDWKTVGYWASLRAATPISPDDGYNFLRLGLTAPIGVKYWELGNEIFYNGYENNQNSETDDHAPYIYENGYSNGFDSRAGVSALSPSSYGNNVGAFLQAMRAVDPTIKIGLVLSSPNVDPIPSTWNPAAIQAACASSTFDFGIFHYYPGSYEAATAAQLFSLPQSDMPNLVAGAEAEIQQYCSNAASVQFFVTETNDNFGLAAGTPTQVVGLYAAHEYLSAFEAGIVNVDWLELHNGGTYLDGNENPQTAFYGIEMAHLLANVGDSLVSATSGSGTVVVHATQKANGQTGVFLLNTDPSNPATVSVTVPGLNAPAGSTATQYSYGINTTQTGPALAGTSLSVTGSTLVVTVPAYTATEVLLP